jgi:hypothetical protein
LKSTNKKIQIKIVSIVESVLHPFSCPESVNDVWEDGINAKFFINGYYKRATLIYQCDDKMLTNNGWKASKLKLKRWGWNFSESDELIENEPSELVFKHLLPKEKQSYVVNLHITPGEKQLSMVQLGTLITYQIEIYKEAPWLKT